MRHLKLVIAALMTIQSAYAQTAQKAPVPQIKVTTPKVPTTSSQTKQESLKVFSSPDTALMRINTDSQAARAEAKKRLSLQQNAILQRLIEGPGSTGGGNLNSMAVLSMIKSLKDVLLAKGLDNFPEIAANWDLFTERINSRILIAEKHPILINGEMKVAEFDRQTNTIYFSVPELKKVVNEPNALLRVQAIMLHEVLGLIGLEGNTDYNISHRLLGLALLENLGAKGSKNQIYPKDPRDAQVIYWSLGEDARVTYIYCKNRDRTNTCHRLGNRSYSQQEVLQAYTELANYYKTQNVIGKRSMITLYSGPTAILVLGFALGGITSAPIWTVIMGASVIVMMTGFVSAGVIGLRLNAVKDMFESSKEASSLTNSQTEMNLEDMAKGLDRFLRTVDQASQSPRRLP